jgi:soluble lytic murein transglycosylase-like protein
MDADAGTFGSAVPTRQRQRFTHSSALVALAGAATIVVAHTASARAEKPAVRTHARAALAAARAEKVCPLPAGLRPAFVHASRDTGLPLSLLIAVARVESNLRADAISGRGARGLLQLMPATAASLRLDPDDPDTNVLAGARYLRRLLDRFSSADAALAAYNAGPTAVERAGGAPTGQTLTYVANVTALWRELEGCA